MTNVFVYGTLKRGGNNHRYLAGQRFLGNRAHHARLHAFFSRDYPGMVPWPADQDGVTGELWAVDDAVLAHLDELEGLAENLYRRAPVTLAAPFAEAVAQSYFYQRCLEGYRHLGPDWPA